MVKNSIKHVNCGHSEPIFEWTRPFLDMKFCRENRNRQGFSKISSVFHLYLPVFYKKIKTVEKSIFCLIFEWSGVFQENQAVSGTPTYYPLSLCQKSKKSLEQLLRSQCDQLPTTNYQNFWAFWMILHDLVVLPNDGTHLHLS